MQIQVGRNARVVTVSGGNLYEIAARELGDHTLWARIARLNGLRDPFLTGVVTLVLPDRPPKGQTTSGVIGA
ncbi:hypothetical protein [Methylobacterium haplocladii]|uniref:LysM domain-containing protein n=1 Tax=Methylobacterium haplocladii TaxID=1176176 RepID=A0A512ISL3_9HYPH|nr:hypothetical protein [Methylobacterium haplocladii]GEP00629.1 hypothetical protein MHA02_30160 [Methylobacterium haplocladii]GJD85544.1 hypothetical protein HPGCJGGD_3433 [Methylobacterium haplocladii]GLS57777.1 hypothetical protein GCM10007887_04330 [Methylobacterium haplocladii]